MWLVLFGTEDVDLHDVIADVEVNREPVLEQYAGPGPRREREAVVTGEPRGSRAERQVNGAVVGPLTAEEYLAR